MKIFQFLAAATLLAFTSPSLVRAQDAPPPPPPDATAPDTDDDQGASFQTFYDQLGDQGSWIQTDDYGYVFQPNVTDPNWAPYSDGHWVYTDDGWLWVSDEPWGWATYHYGRWANIDGTGWVWVPGYRWAPAWVSWRYGGGYAGWAPLPPETIFGAEYGQPGVQVAGRFHFGNDVDVSFGIGPGFYNFVPVDRIGDPNLRGAIVDRHTNYGIINRTTNITNITINNNGPAGAAGSFAAIRAGGPPIAEINRGQTRIQTVQLAAAGQPGRSTLAGNSLAVYAPRFNPATATQARPAQVAGTVTKPQFNRGVSISHPMNVTRSITAPAATPQQVTAAKTALAHVPTSAKIATTKTHLKSPPSTPLTALKPVVATAPHAEATTRQTGIQPAAKPAAVAPQNNANEEAQAAQRQQQAAAAQQEQKQQAAAESAQHEQQAAAQQEQKQQAAAETAQREQQAAAQQEQKQQAAAESAQREQQAAAQHEEEQKSAAESAQHEQKAAPEPQPQHEAAPQPKPQAAPQPKPQAAPQSKPQASPNKDDKKPGQ